MNRGCRCVRRHAQVKSHTVPFCFPIFFPVQHHGRRSAQLRPPAIADFAASAVTAIQEKCLAGTSVRCTRSEHQDPIRPETNQARPSTPASRAIFQIDTLRPSQLQFVIRPTCSILSRSGLNRDARTNSNPPRQLPISSSASSRLMARNTWKRSSGRQCRGMSLSAATDSVRGRGRSSILSRW